MAALAAGGLLAVLGGLVQPAISVAQAVPGRQVARQHCSGCHLFPEPALLDRAGWETHALPLMAEILRLGPAARRRPGRPVIPAADWRTIRAYYLASAPAKLIVPPARAHGDLDLFDVVRPPGPWSAPPATTSISIDGQGNRLLVGSGSGRLDIRSETLRLVGSLPLSGMPVHITPVAAGRFLVTQVGAMVPDDRLSGRIDRVSTAPLAITPLFDNLPRPVQARVLDFDNDGRRDVVFAGFGHMRTGELSLYLQTIPGTFRRRVLVAGPGASVVRIRPRAAGGHEIFALFAQGDERVVRIGPDGKARTVLRFPPSAGSTGLEIVDIDRDGVRDLVHVAGDGADTPGPKPYHGIHVFRGIGNGRFKRAFFFAMPGAYKSRTADFDGDGDADIAAIAFFGDYSADRDAAAFVLLENLGGFRFRARTIRGIGALGRYSALDAGDLDGDGDVDIALASYVATKMPGMSVPPGLATRWSRGPPFVVLRNRLRGIRK